MHEELIKSLRKEAEDTYHFLPKILCLQAADAIETLENTLKIYRESIYSIDNQLPRWISVSERLPEDGVPVLVYVDDLGGYMVVGMWIKDKDYESWLLFGSSRITNVTHWMRLPMPPKEKTDG